MITLLDNETTKIAAIENKDSNYVTLCFTGVGHALGAIDVQSEEFIKASRTATAIFVIDKKRSWGNSLDFVELKNIVHSHGREKTVNAIGNSMGGFLAILASKYMDISNVIAIVPQFSVCKEIFPSENRWDEYVNQIAEWRHVSIADCFVGSTKYYILAGYGGKDDKHLDAMPDGENIHKIYFGGERFIHNVSQALKEDGVLYDVINGCFSGKAPSEIIETNLFASQYEAFIPGRRSPYPWSAR